MSNIANERREYILNNMLLFIKNELEEYGCTKERYWFVVKFLQMVYLMGVSEPQMEPASEDTAKFIKICPCEEDELESAIKYGIAHELLTNNMQGVKITDLGIDKAEEYEKYLEECVSDNQINLNDYVESTDDTVNEKIIKSRNLYLNKDIDGALENIWDAFERIKTIYKELDKKDSAKKVCEVCATSLDFDYINNEFISFTNIGNSYQIRHFETNKKPIKDIQTKVYLFFAMLSIINFAIKQLKAVENDL